MSSLRVISCLLVAAGLLAATEAAHPCVFLGAGGTVLAGVLGTFIAINSLTARVILKTELLDGSGFGFPAEVALDSAMVAGDVAVTLTQRYGGNKVNSDEVNLLDGQISDAKIVATKVIGTAAAGLAAIAAVAGYQETAVNAAVVAKEALKTVAADAIADRLSPEGFLNPEGGGIATPVVDSIVDKTKAVFQAYNYAGSENSKP